MRSEEEILEKANELVELFAVSLVDKKSDRESTLYALAQLTAISWILEKRESCDENECQNIISELMHDLAIKE